MTLKQIAAEAGVSAMTVSNVINHNDDKVSEETRKRVQAIIDKYHYTPNMSARSLSARNSRIIALLMPIYAVDLNKSAAAKWQRREEQSDFNVLSDPYTSMMIGYLEAQLKAKDYYVIIRSFQTPEEVFNLQRSWQVDGCIMITPLISDQENRFLIQNLPCPIVLIDRNFPDLPMLSVSVNDYQGGYLATQECIRFGHKRIAFVSTVDFPITSAVIHNRFQGYQAALRDADIPEEPELLTGFPNEYAGGEACGEYFLSLPLEKRPTAVFATSDTLAIGLITYLKKNGYRIPGDFSIVGYDNLTVSSLIEPQLTTVSQNLRKKAAAAVSLLTETIEAPSLQEKTLHIDVELIRRNSVGPCKTV